MYLKCTNSCSDESHDSNFSAFSFLAPSIVLKWRKSKRISHLSELFLTCDLCIMYVISAYQQQKSKCCDAFKISAGVTFEHSEKGASMLWKNRDKKSWCISTIMNSGRIWWILIPKMGLAAVYDLGHLKLVNQFWPADEKIFILIRLPHP